MSCKLPESIVTVIGTEPQIVKILSSITLDPLTRDFWFKKRLLPLFRVTVSEPELPMTLTSGKFWYPVVME